jgi:hypothetical protein
MTTPTTLTAGDVARYIQRPDEPPGAAIARFRNWEKTGIIEASGDQNPGTGRRKQYSPEAVLRAVLLQTLIDTFGSSAISLSELIGALSKMVREAGSLRESELLVLSRPRGAPRFDIRRVKASQIKGHLAHSSVDIHVVIDIKRLFDRIAHDWEEKFRRDDPRRAAFEAAYKEAAKYYFRLAKAKSIR